MVKTLEQRKIKLNNRDAEKFWRLWTYTEFLGEVETYLSVLAPGLLARRCWNGVLAFRDQAIVT